MAKQLGKEGKTTPADEKARTEAIGGNLNQDTFLQSCQEIAAANAKCKAAAEERSRVRKTVKARGIELGILDATLKMADWDREEVRLAFDNRRRYAEWLGLPIGVQADMFKDMTPEQKAQAEAHARGVTDARVGRSGQPPEDLADDLHDAYTRGFKGKALEAKPKGPKKDAKGAVVAPPHGQAHDPDFDEVDEGKGSKVVPLKQPVPADTDAALT